MTPLIQTLVAIVGVLTGLLTLYQQWSAIISKPSEPSPSRSHYDWQLCSIAMALAALLSVAAIHSLYLNDWILLRTPYGFAVSVAVTTLLFVFMLLCWKAGRFERYALPTTWWVFILVILSPAGLFGNAGSLSNPLSLVLPLLFLYAVVCCLYAYQFGGLLFSRQNIERDFLRQLLYLAIPALIGATLTGKLYTSSLLQDDRAPRALEQDGRALLEKLQRLPPADFHRLYQVFSELECQSFYERTHSQIDTSLERANKDDRLSPSSSYVTAVLATLPVTADAQKTFFERRLDWVHPASQPTEVNRPIPIPGNTALTRLRQLEAFRISVVLRELPLVRQEVIDTFSRRLPATVTKRYGSEQAEPPSQLSPFGPMPTVESDDGNATIELNNAFPYRDLPTYDTALQKQLALPLDYEVYAAYECYLRAARSAPELTTVNTLFNELSQTQQSALVRFFTSPADDRDSRLIMMAKLTAIDFSPIMGQSDRRAAVERLVQLLGSPASSSSVDKQDENLQKLATDIKAALSSSELRHFSTSLRASQNTAVILPLLNKEPLALLKTLEHEEDTIKKNFLYGLNRPVEAVWKDAKLVSQSRPLIEAFLSLSEWQREAILNHMTLEVYRPSGPYSLNTLGSFALLLKSYSEPASLAIGCVVALPLFLVALVLGSYGANLMRLRSALDESLRRESEEQRPSCFAPDDSGIVGRTSLLSLLESVSYRGRSTIAIAGRRGIGKSRVMRQLYLDAASRHRVVVWVATPSQREDLVLALYEQVVVSVDYALSTSLSIPKLEVRRTMRRTSIVSLAIFGAIGVACTVLGIMCYQLGSVGVSVPAGLLVAVGAVIMILDYESSSPRLWQQVLALRNGDMAYHNFMLYESLQSAVRQLQREENGIAAEVRRSLLYVLRVIGVIVLGYLLMELTVRLLHMKSIEFPFPVPVLSTRREALSLMAGLVILLGVVMAFSSYARLAFSGRSAVSLAEQYRTFLAAVVARLRRGAVGSPETTGDATVVVCIDELDKIEDEAERRAALRDLKSLFDVDGVRYFVSMADESADVLKLGAIAGKNEVDSTFDHVFRVGPITLDEAIQLAMQRCGSGESELAPMASAIGFLSFGVPREIMRRSEIMTAGREVSAKCTSSEVLRMERVECISSALSAGFVSLGDATGLSGDSAAAHLFAVELMKRTKDEYGKRLCVYVALMCIAENAFVPPVKLAVLEELYSIGFDIPERQPEELLDRVQRLCGDTKGGQDGS